MLHKPSSPADTTVANAIIQEGYDNDYKAFRNILKSIRPGSLDTWFSRLSQKGGHSRRPV